MTVIDTSVGPAAVLHRLALAVEVVDPLTDRLAVTPLRVGRELVRRTRTTDPRWPCAKLDAGGPARFKLRHQHPLPRRVVVRLDDPSRRFVPRRLRIALWPVGRLDRSLAQTYITTSHRLLRAWLWPGAAAALPAGSTLVRGRVVRPEGVARWVRVTARDQNGRIVGRAHGDDRGEFVLVVTDQTANPLPPVLALTLRVHARRRPATVDAFDPCADLVVERLQRSPEPPADALLESPALRGTRLPAPYAANARPDTLVNVPTGTEVVLADELVFVPTP
jgi:hypothetical protein